MCVILGERTLWTHKMNSLIVDGPGFNWMSTERITSALDIEDEIELTCGGCRDKPNGMLPRLENFWDGATVEEMVVRSPLTSWMQSKERELLLL